MLVLVSFGLVLLATILLVVGLLSDDGLTLIYLSIAASATAAVVLYVAFRRARAKGETTASSDGPAPLAEDLVPQPPTEEPTAVVPAAAEPEPAPPVEAEPSQPAPAPETVPASVDDDWMADADWEGGEVDFPIADYDDLTVAEIMPLLPQLYSDELDDVIERERAGKNRSTIIGRLEELKVIGTDADAEEFAAGAPAPEPETAPEPEPEPEPAPAATASASSGRGSSLLDLDDEDGGDYLFPIADYDNLSVAQIVPLLSQLEADELQEVRAREVDGANRKTLLTEIDALLPGATPDVEPEPPAAARPAKRKAAPARRAKKASSKKKAASKKKATPARRQKKAAKKSAKKKAAKKATRFPIADYDELNVADIRPRLTDLSDRQLQQVRERELAGAGRKTILKEIDKKLG